MTPSARRRKLHTLAARTERMSEEVQLASELDDPLAQLQALHGLAAELADIRNRMADAKGAAACIAKNSHTHEQIAAVLGVSKPYVQQMVYRGRSLDS